jgi:hypothetical protein
VTYPGFTPVGNATLVVANVLTCNKHSQKYLAPQQQHLLLAKFDTAVAAARAFATTVDITRH